MILQEYTPSKYFCKSLLLPTILKVANLSLGAYPKRKYNPGLVIIFPLVPVKLAVQSYSCWDTIRFLRARLLARRLPYHYKELQLKPPSRK